MTQKIEIPNEYPVELGPPDIRRWADGGTGVPYLHRFDSGRRGPHLMVSAIVHGNEPCGAIALDRLLAGGFRPSAGRVSFLFANIAAYEAFDPGDPNATRWVDEDMNRVWGADVLDGPRDSVELRRARQIRPALAGVDLLLDVHSMQHTAPAVALSGRHDKGVALARGIGVPETIIADSGHAAGKRMRDYGAFDDPDAGAAAVLIECGQHWAAGAGALAEEAVARFLVQAGVASDDMTAAYRAPSPPGAWRMQQRVWRVREVVTIETDAFRFAGPYTGGEVIAAAGTVIGHDGDRPVVTPVDDCMLVMPSKRLWPGQTAVRLAERVG
ncbi:MAG: succinylglutamate desuccinylase/aspartoacylase family protein [Pseudomonadota bacterium]